MRHVGGAQPPALRSVFTSAEAVEQRDVGDIYFCFQRSWGTVLLDIRCGISSGALRT